jgi:hypothetical protein
MAIKYKILEQAGNKVLVEALIVLFAWVNVIYTQDLWSTIVFGILCFY